MSDYIVDPIDKTRAIHAPSGQMAGAVFVGPASDGLPVDLNDLKTFTPIGWAPPFGWESPDTRPEEER